MQSTAGQSGHSHTDTQRDSEWTWGSCRGAWTYRRIVQGVVRTCWILQESQWGQLRWSFPLSLRNGRSTKRARSFKRGSSGKKAGVLINQRLVVPCRLWSEGIEGEVSTQREGGPREVGETKPGLGKYLRRSHKGTQERPGWAHLERVCFTESWVGTQIKAYLNGRNK